MAYNLLPVTNIGSSGINTDVAPWDLAPAFITDGMNYRVSANAVHSSAGHTLWTIPGSWHNGSHLLYLNQNGVDYYIMPGENGIFVFDGSTQWRKIGTSNYPTIDSNSKWYWTHAILGELPVINNPQWYPEYWPLGGFGLKMKPLQFTPTETFQDRKISCGVIREHKNFLFALNLNDDGFVNVDGYRWSHPADQDGLPYTWDETDPASLAGISQLGGDFGAILDGLTLRDSFVIYSENGINILNQTLDTLVFKRRVLSTSVGIMSNDCVVEVNNNHYFLTKEGDMMITDGTTLQSISHNKISRRIKNNMTASFYSRSYVLANIADKEIWFCVPENGADHPSTVYIYNYVDKSWAIREIPFYKPYDTYTHMTYGPYNEQNETWDDGDDLWSEHTGSWDAVGGSPGQERVIGCNGFDSSINIMDTNNPKKTPQTVPFIERTNFPLIDERQVTTIVRIYPRIQSTGKVLIQVGSHRESGGAVHWKPAIEFTPGVDRKIDLRTTGELHAWRISSIDNSIWYLSGLEIEYTLNGVR